MKARDNPFAADRIEAIGYRPEGCTWPQLMAQLRDLNYHCAIVGPEGTGKTTLLEELGRRLVAEDMAVSRISLRQPAGVLLPADVRWHLRDIDPAAVLLVDSAGLLSRAGLAHLLWRTRRLRGLIVTSHRPMRLPTLLECRPQPAILAGIIRELLSADDHPAASRAEELLAHHGGNMRNALRELYDTWAAT